MVSSPSSLRHGPGVPDSGRFPCWHVYPLGHPRRFEAVPRWERPMPNPPGSPDEAACAGQPAGAGRGRCFILDILQRV